MYNLPLVDFSVSFKIGKLWLDTYQVTFFDLQLTLAILLQKFVLWNVVQGLLSLCLGHAKLRLKMFNSWSQPLDLSLVLSLVCCNSFLYTL